MEDEKQGGGRLWWGMNEKMARSLKRLESLRYRTKALPYSFKGNLGGDMFLHIFFYHEEN